jgi:hypothetical protein
MFRKKMGKRYSKRNFSKHSGSRKRNFASAPMRGGFRI